METNPLGEIVPVSFEYRLLAKEASREQSGFIRKEDIRYGESSKRFTTDGKTANPQDNRVGERSQRDNRDSALTPVMLQEMTSVENPVKHPVILKKLQKPTEVYNKRRYEESFASSKLREAERKRETKKSVARKEEGVRVPEKSHDRLSALAAKEPLKIASPSLQEALRLNTSEKHLSDSHFKQELPGKLPDHCDAPGSEGGSSAIKKSQI
ncbi:hypothetical protein F2Q70_00019155 [Brassica cretica]|uniref:Uncharacterized protein n=1 Tax=Brassica cretica TaxID=69181 RepID=A0A8S9GXT3_BRACR|nr:hypothetical protein F2Q70_00019155 [Brassica cretica]